MDDKELVLAITKELILRTFDHFDNIKTNINTKAGQEAFDKIGNNFVTIATKVNEALQAISKTQE